jgi:hypothetical protein
LGLGLRVQSSTDLGPTSAFRPPTRSAASFHSAPNNAALIYLLPHNLAARSGGRRPGSSWRGASEGTLAWACGKSIEQGREEVGASRSTACPCLPCASALFSLLPSCYGFSFLACSVPLWSLLSTAIKKVRKDIPLSPSFSSALPFPSTYTIYSNLVPRQ